MSREPDWLLGEVDCLRRGPDWLSEEVLWGIADVGCFKEGRAVFPGETADCADSDAGVDAGAGAYTGADCLMSAQAHENAKLQCSVLTFLNLRPPLVGSRLSSPTARYRSLKNSLMALSLWVRAGMGCRVWQWGVGLRV